MTLTLTLVGGSSNGWSTTEIIEAQINEAVNKGISLVVKVPFDALPANRSNIHQVTFSRAGEGVLFNGYLLNMDSTWASDGSEVAVLTFEGTEVELKHMQVGKNVVFRNISLVACRDMLVQIGTDNGLNWYANLVGPFDPTNITYRFDNMTLFDAFIEFANIIGGFIQFDHLNRVMQIRKNTPSSTVSLRDAVPTAFSLPAYGLVESIDRIGHDRTNLYNEVYAEAMGRSEVITLQNSNKNSPYIRQHSKPTYVYPNIVGVRGSEGLVWGNYWEGYIVDVAEVESDGTNRGNLVISHMLHENPGFPAVYHWGNGAFRWDFVHDYDGTYPYHALTYSAQTHPNVPNMNTAQVAHNMPPFGGSSWSAGFHNVLITLSDINRWSTAGAPLIDFNSVFVREANADQGFTNPLTRSLFIPNNNTYRGSLLLDVVAVRGNVVATPTSGQTVIYNRFVNISGYESRLVVSFVKPNLDQWNNFNWSFNWSTGRFIRQIIRIDSPYRTVIRDQNSINLYGRRTSPINLGDYNNNIPEYSSVPTAWNGILRSANSMYDRTVHYLNTVKEPHTTYSIKVGHLPNNPLTWNVGNTVSVVTSKVNATLVVPERKQIYSSDGIRKWEIITSTQARFRETFIDALKNSISQNSRA